MPERHDHDVGVDQAVDVFRLAEIVVGALIVLGALDDATPCRLADCSLRMTLDAEHTPKLREGSCGVGSRGG